MTLPMQEVTSTYGKVQQVCPTNLISFFLFGGIGGYWFIARRHANMTKQIGCEMRCSPNDIIMSPTLYQYQ